MIIVNDIQMCLKDSEESQSCYQILSYLQDNQQLRSLNDQPAQPKLFQIQRTPNYWQTWKSTLTRTFKQDYYNRCHQLISISFDLFIIAI